MVSFCVGVIGFTYNKIYKHLVCVVCMSQFVFLILHTKSLFLDRRFFFYKILIGIYRLYTCEYIIEEKPYVICIYIYTTFDIVKRTLCSFPDIESIDKRIFPRCIYMKSGFSFNGTSATLNLKKAPKTTTTARAGGFKKVAPSFNMNE